MLAKPSLLLQIEGLVVMCLVGVYYYNQGYSRALFFALLLAPDISILAYQMNPAIGAKIYNLFHTYTIPLLLGMLGQWIQAEMLFIIALIWVFHIGMDRILEYGLKYPDNFKHTHLGR